jgi:hypothetical protein
MFKLLILAVAVLLGGCAFRTPDHDVSISVPAIDIDVTPEYRNRVHLNREWVDRGTRYCRYSDGRVTRHHWRDVCARAY